MPQQITLFEQNQNGQIITPLGGGLKSIQIIRKIQLIHTYNDIINLENLCLAWKEFILGRKKKNDVLKFSDNLMDNIVTLHEDLASKIYQHGGYENFYVNDPKRRHIHKAAVCDRLLHHAIYRILYPFFDRTFIDNSFSCRKNKGLHKALNKFREMFCKVSKNNHRAYWVLKCDIKKFFDSIDHKILLDILSEYISDKDVIWLLGNVVESYSTTPATPLEPLLGNRGTTGLPLGNLTSQLFANVFMNVFDQFVKHKLKVKYYVRYADDFVFLSNDRQYLESIIPVIRNFLVEKLKLTLHPNKIFLQTITSGIDFLGWKHFVGHRVLRKTTRKRMLRRIKENHTNETLQSYLGLLSHGNGGKVKEQLLNEYWFNKNL